MSALSRGSLSANRVANYEGSKVCVEEVNAVGGMAGEKLRLIREDDQYKPQEIVRLLREVAAREKPVAFISLLGSENVGAILKERLVRSTMSRCRQSESPRVPKRFARQAVRGLTTGTIDFTGGNVDSSYVEIGVITRDGRLMY